jgi:chromosome segregation ATPase
MADQDAGGTQAEPQAAPQAGEETVDAAALAAELREARKEAANYRTKLRKLEGQSAQQQQSGESEAETLKRQNEELQQQLAGLLAERQERSTREAIATAAAKAGAIYPDKLYRLADDGDIELDEAGNVRNATAVVNKLRQAYPALFRAVSVDGGAGGGDKPLKVGGLNAFIRGAG